MSVPDFVKPGAKIRVSYEIEVESVADMPSRYIFLDIGPRPTIELIEPAPSVFPDEPAGLGAVIEVTGKDDRIAMYIRVTEKGSIPWRPTSKGGPPAPLRRWSEICAVAKEIRVLGPGVVLP